MDTPLKKRVNPQTQSFFNDENIRSDYPIASDDSRVYTSAAYREANHEAGDNDLDQVIIPAPLVNMGITMPAEAHNSVVQLVELTEMLAPRSHNRQATIVV